MKYSINLKFRPSSKEGHIPGRLYFRVIHQRQIVHINTIHQVFPEEWDKKNEIILLPVYKSLRTSYLQQIIKSIRLESEEISQQVKNMYNTGFSNIHEWAKHYRLADKHVTLSSFGKEVVEELYKAGQERTARAYQSVIRNIIYFNNRKDFPFNELTEAFVKGYERELKEKGKSLNTISFYMRNLRAIYNKAQKKGIVPQNSMNPFRHVYTGVPPTRKRALSKEEIIRLNEIFLLLNPSAREEPTIDPVLFDPKYQETLTYFFFSFYSRGMSFVDMAYLRKENIRSKSFSYYRKKSGSYLEIKITPVLQIIIENMKKLNAHSSYLFPIIKRSEQSERLQYESALRLYNKRLKKIGRYLNIHNPITSHVARHSWASIAKHENFPLWVISESLGHSNEQTTYIYLSSLDHSMLDEANEKITEVIKKRI